MLEQLKADVAAPPVVTNLTIGNRRPFVSMRYLQISIWKTPARADTT